MDDLLADLHHDIGKAISLNQRWLGQNATEDDRLEAVRDDLLRTRRGPMGTQSAVELWSQYRTHPEMPLLCETAMGQELGELMAKVSEYCDQFTHGRPIESLVEIEMCCARVSQLLSDWNRLLRQRKGESSG